MSAPDQIVEGDLEVEDHSTVNQLLIHIPAPNFKQETIKTNTWVDAKEQKRVRITARGSVEQKDGIVDQLDLMFERRLPKNTQLEMLMVKFNEKSEFIIVSAPFNLK